MRARYMQAGLVALSLVVSGATVASMYRTHNIHTPVFAGVDCAAWDQAASLRIATLIGNDSAAADLRLDAVLAQLRRARKYCRSGFAGVAVSDYRAIERAIPMEHTASIPPTSD
jgi:hypothetical protein